MVTFVAHSKPAPFLALVVLGVGCSGDATSSADAAAADAPFGNDAAAEDSALDRPNDLRIGIGTIRDASDAGVAPAPPVVSCNTPADCDRLPRPDSVSWCRMSSAWSCIAGQCAWGCSATRTCNRASLGCFVCTPPQPPSQCPGRPCSLTGPTVVEQTTCAAPPDITAWSCFGDWAMLRDGTWCEIHDLSTGLQRWSVTCGACQTVFVSR